MSARTAWAAVLLVLVLACPALGEAAATWSFGAGDNATCPATVAAGSTITVDLSALPAGAKVFRAVLRCERQSGPGWQREGDKAVVTLTGSAEALALLPPRYASFDATAAVAKAVDGQVVQTGRATPDVHGRITLEKVTVTKDRNRIKLVAARR